MVSAPYCTRLLIRRFGDITKTCPCNKQRFFSAVKHENFTSIILMFFLFLLKTLIVDTH